jgi:hypothetical protein
MCLEEARFFPKFPSKSITRHGVSHVSKIFTEILEKVVHAVVTKIATNAMHVSPARKQNATPSALCVFGEATPFFQIARTAPNLLGT